MASVEQTDIDCSALEPESLFGRALHLTSKLLSANSRRSLALGGLAALAPLVRGAGKERAPIATGKHRLFGHDLRNPIGMAAGIDKDGGLIDPLSLCGFGFIEVGSVTPNPQSGQALPNVYDAAKKEGRFTATFNHMGCPNQGLDAFVRNLQKRRWQGGLVGANIARQASTSTPQAHEDYAECFAAVAPFVDYVTINVSSPNTVDLINLQQPEHLRKVLTAVVEKRREIDVKTPIVAKFGPQFDEPTYRALIDLVAETGCEGIALTNTLPGVGADGAPAAKSDRAGGFGGSMLVQRARQVLDWVGPRARDLGLDVIAVGGIGSAEEVRRRLDQGANAVQLLSAFVYGGPRFVHRTVNRFNQLDPNT